MWRSLNAAEVEMGGAPAQSCRAVKERTAGREMTFAPITLPPPKAKRRRLKITERGSEEV